MTTPGVEWIMARVDTDGPVPEHRPDLGPCWIWTRYLEPRGYGRTKTKGACVLTHRLVYEALVGPIPDGLEPDHLCRVHACCRPDHLEMVTHAENVRRGEVGRHNAVKTHCPQGHPYDEANTLRKAGSRSCRACHRASMRAYRARVASAR